MTSTITKRDRSYYWWVRTKIKARVSLLLHSFANLHPQEIADANTPSGLLVVVIKNTLSATKITFRTEGACSSNKS